MNELNRILVNWSYAFNLAMLFALVVVSCSNHSVKFEGEASTDHRVRIDIPLCDPDHPKYDDEMCVQVLQAIEAAHAECDTDGGDEDDGLAEGDEA